VTGLPRNDWAGRSVIVTGGASGIGLATARMIAGRGGRVVVADVNAAAAQAAADDLGDSVVAFSGTVSDPEVCRRMASAAVDTFGRLDAAVNCAGVNLGRGVSLAEIDVDDYRRIIDVNVNGTFFSMQAEITAMLAGGAGGSIVNVGSVLSQVGRAGNAPYAASKHAILGFTRAAALEYGEAGIRINCVGPGFIPTGLSGGASPEAAAAMVARHHAIPRAGTPDEVAEVICFLASDAAALCTGGWYAADAGWTAE
jgi:NAD(P)-dependent dehydrogenase (short-subunit alcohol dehydrogenase family)